MTLASPSEATGPSTEDFLKGLWTNNPVFVSVMGMCPVLAVTNTAVNALTMGVATAVVLLLSSGVVSALRSFVPSQVRIVTYIFIIASFVTAVDYLIQAISFDVHKALGAFISLIVVNCVILGRAEAFASKHSVARSILDALGMGLGFSFALLCLGSVREVLGSGTWFGLSVMPKNFQPWLLMSLPSGGFFTLALWLLTFNAVRERRRGSAAHTAAEAT